MFQYDISRFFKKEKSESKSKSQKRNSKGPRRRRAVQFLLKIDTKCHYCKKELTEDTVTIDHLIPKSRGGSNARHNLALACTECNGKKGNLTETEYFEFLAEKWHESQNSQHEVDAYMRGETIICFHRSAKQCYAIPSSSTH